MINIIQLNLRKSPLAAAELQKKADDLNSDFLCLVQEPSVYKGKFRNRPYRSRAFPSSFITENPRAGIIYSDRLKVSELPTLEDKDSAVAILKNGSKTMIIASLYLDYTNKEVITDKLRELVCFADDKNLPILIGMDSNCHSTMFGNSTNSRGKILEDFIITNSFQVENKGTTPTFRSSRYSTCIDVTLSRDLTNVIKEWRVDDDFNASDHNTITFGVDLGMIEIPRHRNWNKANWGLFKTELETATFFRPDRMTDCKLDKLVRKLYFVINKALDKACPIIDSKRTDPLNEWFTEELEVARKEVIECLNRAKRTESGSEAWSRYKKKFKKYRASVRRSKRKYWNYFKTKCEDAKQTSGLVKILQRRDNNFISTFKTGGGNFTMPGEETARHLLDTHFPSNAPVSKIKYSHCKTPSYEIEGRFTSWINEDNVKEALLKFEHKKSPGPDGLRPVLFQHLPDNIIKVLTFLYKCCIALSFTPSLWRDAKVIFIPKPGKADYSLSSSFRPISLSNYLLKGLERLCVWRVDQSLINYPIHDRQHGFRCDRSTETAISEVVNEIEKHIFKRQRTLAVFLDIKSAFDSISPEHIRKCLLNHRAPPLLVDWYYDYITKRNVTIELQDSKIEASIGVGFPQGGVASARFWLIAFNMAVKIINRFGCSGTAFADDCAVLLSGTHTNTLVNNMQKTLREIERWGRRSGLKFNPAKTVVIMFERRKEKQHKLLEMGDTKIQYSKEVKYLGVTLDSKLNWRPHINAKLGAAKKLMYVINQAIRGNWGPTPSLSKWALTGIVRPALTYACGCWAHAVTTKKLKGELDRIDRLGLLSVTQVAPSTPTQALRIAYDVPPTRLLIEKLAVDFLIRYKDSATLTWDGLTRSKKQSKSHLRFLWDIVAPWGFNSVTTDDIRSLSPPRLYRVVTDSLNKNTKFLTQSQVNIYTDGSKTEEGVGAGYIVYKGKNIIISGEHRLGDECTVFQAEVFAIFESVRRLFILPDKGNIKFVKIFTDSAAAMYALRKRKCRSKLVLYTMKMINKLAECGTHISIVWIKAHVGHVGNEAADGLAKEGAGLDVEEKVWVNQPIGSYKTKSRLLLYRKWNSEWLGSRQARMAKLFFPTTNPALSDELTSLHRTDLTTIITMTSGHNDLRYHTHLRDRSTDPRCRLCLLEDETFYHLLTFCPRLKELRFKLYGAYALQRLYSWDPERLLQFIREIPFPIRAPMLVDEYSFSSSSIYSYTQSPTTNDVGSQEPMLSSGLVGREEGGESTDNGL